MELEFNVYKESYKNIAEQIKELETPDNKKEIRKLERVIERNQQKIQSWKKGTYDPSVWLSEEMFEEHENARFEEYAEPYNANISQAQKMISELELGMDENQKTLKENREKQTRLKVYADNVRKNAEIDYKNSRKAIVEEWEKSEEKKKYDSNLETINIINSRRPNLLKAEQEALIRLNGENIKLQQVLGGKLKRLEDEYRQFLAELDKIDKECGIKKLTKMKIVGRKGKAQETKKETPVEPKVKEVPVQEEAEETPVAPKVKEVPVQEEAEETPVEPKVKEVPVQEEAEEVPVAPETTSTKKISIEITAKGTELKIDGKGPGKQPLSTTQERSEKKNGIVKELQGEILEKYRKAQNIDYRVTDEILIAFAERRLTSVEEVEQQLDAYIAMMEGKQNDNFTLLYDLRGMGKAVRKNEITSLERDVIEIKAKKVRDLGLETGKVTAPWYVEAKWWIKDTIDSIKNAKGFKGKLKAIGTRSAGSLPAGKGEERVTSQPGKKPKPGELTPEQTAEQRKRQAEIAAEHTEKQEVSKVDSQMSALINEGIEQSND